jgi:hypothetical protein
MNSLPQKKKKKDALSQEFEYWAEMPWQHLEKFVNFSH